MDVVARRLVYALEHFSYSSQDPVTILYNVYMLNTSGASLHVLARSRGSVAFLIHITKATRLRSFVPRARMWHIRTHEGVRPRARYRHAAPFFCWTSTFDRLSFSYPIRPR